MINFVEGNILETACDILVVPTNTKGVAGAGLALAVKQKYPEWFIDYKDNCLNYKLKGGDCLWYATTSSPQYFCSIMTKEDWHYQSRLDWVCKGLQHLSVTVDSFPTVDVVNVPLLGCGKGGLDVKVVKREMVKALKDSNKLFRVFDN